VQFFGWKFDADADAAAFSAVEFSEENSAVTQREEFELLRRQARRNISTWKCLKQMSHRAGISGARRQRRRDSWKMKLDINSIRRELDERMR